MAVERKKRKEKKSMIIVVPSCLKDADGARTRSDQNMQNSGLRLSDTVCTAPLRPKSDEKLSNMNPAADGPITAAKPRAKVKIPEKIFNELGLKPNHHIYQK